MENATYVRKDISLITKESEKVKLSKSILECLVSGCAECNPSNNVCYYCMNGAKLINEPLVPSGPPTPQCKSN